jgi:hypothetical protein
VSAVRALVAWGIGKGVCPLVFVPMLKINAEYRT